MARFTLILISFTALCLSACSDTEANLSENDIAKIESQSQANLAGMDIGEIIDYLNEQSEHVADVLKSVTDETTAKAAINDLRVRGVKFKAALETFETIDENEISFGMLRKLPKLMQTQADLISEISRINEIPEAREVVQAELDKLKLGDLKFDE